MLKDKNGKTIQGADIVLVDQGLVGERGFLLKMRYDPGNHMWLGEKLKGDPTPQNLDGLGHRITLVSRGTRSFIPIQECIDMWVAINQLEEECNKLRIDNVMLRDKLRKSC